MRNMIYGILGGALVFGALSWATSKKTAHAAVLTAPPAGRFELVQLHPSAGSEWSGILDTETGCTWAYSSFDANDPKITVESTKSYYQVLGNQFFALVNFDPTDYGMLKVDANLEPDYGPALKEVARVQQACSQARLQALKAASSH